VSFKTSHEESGKEAKMKEIVMVPPFLTSSIAIPVAAEAYSDFKELDVVGLDEGKDPLVTFSDLELNMTGLLKKLVEVEKKGYRAAIIGCFGDPGLTAARQLLSIPVIGPGETALAIASTLGDRVLLIEPAKDLVYVTEKMVYAYGLKDKVVGIFSLDEKGAEACVTRNEEGIRHAAETCLKGVRDTRAQVIITGCIGFCLMVDAIDRALKESGFYCPIIEPGRASIEYAKMLLRLGLNQSREMFRM
jgi:allantoin racemase